ncbi:winged helix-turn-helix transcriptional regulator [Cuniculiplasma sp. SKW4]|uniref:winged helix-turn-helix transcriptional regulator n=1 Tax=Cuniculiplasma sp. SKW4 TaxID=3400171 RepID=UPI003FCF4F6D
MGKDKSTCPFLEMFSVMSKKWTMLILATIGESGKIGYMEISRNLGGVSPKALTDSLNLLLSKGFIDKMRIKGIPPRVEYTLTERGKEIVSLLRPLIFWAVEATGHMECQIVGHFMSQQHHLTENGSS